MSVAKLQQPLFSSACLCKVILSIAKRLDNMGEGRRGEGRGDWESTDVGGEWDPV